VASIVRLVQIGADSDEPFADVMTINRLDDLDDIANLGLTVADGKRVLAGFQQEIVAAQARSHSVQRPECRSCRGLSLSRQNVPIALSSAYMASSTSSCDVGVAELKTCRIRG
jgi:hypothetical protein